MPTLSGENYSSEKAAKLVNVSARSIRNAKTVRGHMPELKSFFH